METSTQCAVYVVNPPGIVALCDSISVFSAWLAEAIPVDPH